LGRDGFGFWRELHQASMPMTRGLLSRGGLPPSWLLPSWFLPSWLLPSLALATLGCGSVAPEPLVSGTLVIERQSDARIAGRYSGDGVTIDFSSASSSPLSGDIAVRAGSLLYDVRYDYEHRSGETRQVVTDGHGGALDPSTHRALGDALEQVSERLGTNDPTLPLHEQMLFAGLALLVDSSGMPLPRMSFPLDPTEVDKSLGNDGVTCIERDTTYGVSFDVASTTVVDAPVVSNSSVCNGQCGPACVQLTPWRMWTLDCLEHDTCCGATSNDPCWTPLGECGDEYVDAEADFLRGFDPFSAHCGG
jgi:hypothetical protein